MCGYTYMNEEGFNKTQSTNLGITFEGNLFEWRVSPSGTNLFVYNPKKCNVSAKTWERVVNDRRSLHIYIYLQSTALCEIDCISQTKQICQQRKPSPNK